MPVLVVHLVKVPFAIYFTYLRAYVQLLNVLTKHHLVNIKTATEFHASVKAIAGLDIVINILHHQFALRLHVAEKIQIYIICVFHKHVHHLSNVLQDFAI